MRQKGILSERLLVMVYSLFNFCLRSRNSSRCRMTKKG